MDHPVRHPSLRQVVTDEIREMIMWGEIAPGERLVEEKLAVRLGVSRNPVREAIRQLESTTLVEVTPRHGACATLVDGTQVRPLQELRMVLEGWVAKEAALRRSEHQLELLTRCVQLGESAQQAGDTHLSRRWVDRYRETVDAASGNRYVHASLQPLREQVDRTINVLGGEGAPRWHELAELRDAIADCDAQCARYLVLTQLSDAVQRFEGNSSDPLYESMPLYRGERHWHR
jgi:DNA-binding GntR family transcriptional regulator